MGILRNTVYSILTASILSGCYSDFTGRYEAEPVLCINSLITAGEPIEVEVTHTCAYPDAVNNVIEYDGYFVNKLGYDMKVTDAVVEIYVNGTIRDNDYIPKEGDQVRIVATSRKYGMAEGEVTVPYAVPIDNLTWDASIKSTSSAGDSNGEYEFSVKFKLDANLTLHDTLNSEDYFHLAYGASYNNEEEEASIAEDNDTGDEDTDSYPDKSDYFSMGELKYQSEPIFSEHIGMIDAISGMDAYGFTFFTDRSFSGDKYTLRLIFDDMEIRADTGQPDAADFDWNVYFDLYTISKSMYNLVNYQWHTYEGLLSDIGNIGLCEPMWGYSNVSTGAGVIAARSRATCKINLKDYFLSQIRQL